MAGTQTQAENTIALRVSTIDPGSNSPNSLRGLDVSVMPQGSQVWVNDANALYRWDDSSSATADNDNVVAPVTGSGRWIKTGGSADTSGNFEGVAQQALTGDLTVTIGAPNTPVFIGGARLNQFTGPWQKGVANADDLRWIGPSSIGLFAATFIIKNGTAGDVVRVSVSSDAAPITAAQIPSVTLDGSGAGQLNAALQFTLTQNTNYRWTASNESNANNFDIDINSIVGLARLGQPLVFVP